MDQFSNQDDWGDERIIVLLQQSIQQQEQEYIKIVQLFEEKSNVIQIILSNIKKENPEMIEVIKNFQNQDNIYKLGCLLEINQQDNQFLQYKQENINEQKLEQIIKQDKYQERNLITNPKDQTNKKKTLVEKLPCQFCKSQTLEKLSSNLINLKIDKEMTKLNSTLKCF